MKPVVTLLVRKDWVAAGAWTAITAQVQKVLAWIEEASAWRPMRSCSPLDWVWQNR